MEEKTTTEVKNLKPGRFVIVDGEPCTVTNIQISKPGKHGAAKARVETVGVFDNQKRVFIAPSAEKVNMPIIEKRNCQVLSIFGDTAQLMDLEDYSTFELQIPPELKERVKEGGEVLVWRYGHRMMIRDVRG